MMTTIRHRLPLLTAVILFTVLLSARQSHVRTVEQMRVTIDSVASAGRKVVEAQSLVLQPGDSIPRITLVANDGDTLYLDALPSSHRYLYFYRDDCPGCDILSAAWLEVAPSKRDSVMFVAVGAAEFGVPVLHRDGMTWLISAADRGRYVRRIPTLVVRSTDGRVLSVAHGSVEGVAKLMDLFGLGSLSSIKRDQEEYLERVALRGRLTTTSLAND